MQGRLPIHPCAVCTGEDDGACTLRGMPPTTPEETRKPRELLNTMLGVLKEHKRNPIAVSRALRSVVRGDVDTADFFEMRDLTHAIFDWMCEFDKQAVDPADLELIEIDVDAIADREERVAAGRLQRKALRRVRKATAVKQSKVDPALVEAVAHRIANSYTPECAADALWFASGLLPELKPADVIRFLEDTTPVKSAWRNPANISEWADTVRNVNTEVLGIFKDPVELWVGIYLLNHTWNESQIIHSKKLTNAQVLAIHHTNASRKPLVSTARVCGDIEGSVETYQRVLGRRIDEQVLADSYGRMSQRTGTPERLLLSAAAVNAAYKPVADYAHTCDTIIKRVRDVRKKANKPQIVNVWDLLYAVKHEFKVPEEAVFLNRMIGGVSYTTITDETALKRNETYMRNCTYGTYYSRYRNGVGVLFVAKAGGETYNIDLSVLGGSWELREAKARFNRAVTPQVRNSIPLLIQEIKGAT